MKHLTDEEQFQKTAEIGACLYSLSLINKELLKLDNRNPIDIMVDKATGYEDTQYIELYQGAIECLSHLISCKKQLGIDAVKDIELLAAFENNRQKQVI